MSILVTGGTGFLGWYLAKALAEDGEDVIAFDITPLKNYQRLSKIDKLQVINGDLSSWSEVTHVIKKYKIKQIFHNGALLSETAENKHIEAFRVNVAGTFNLLEVARIFDIDKFIFTSTLATYGRDVGEIISHDSPQRPSSMYGVTKVFCERMGEYYSSRFGLDFRAVRFPSVIGPGRGGGGLSSFTTLIIQEPALGRPYRVFVNRDTRCPFIYIKDAIKCLILLFCAEKRKIKSKTYVISGMSPTAEEIADLVRKYIPTAEIEFSPDQEKDKIVRSWPHKFDESDAMNEWGWKSEYGLEETMRDFIKEVQSNKEIYL